MNMNKTLNLKELIDILDKFGRQFTSVQEIQTNVINVDLIGLNLIFKIKGNKDQEDPGLLINSGRYSIPERYQ